MGETHLWVMYPYNGSYCGICSMEARATLNTRFFRDPCTCFQWDTFTGFVRVALNLLRQLYLPLNFQNWCRSIWFVAICDTLATHIRIETSFHA
jgi:hypothetical protein